MESRRILVTNGYGFVGRHLLEMWVEENPHDSIFTIEQQPQTSFHPNIEVAQNGLNKLPEVKALLNWFRPDAVLHLSGNTWSEGLINLIEACKLHWEKEGRKNCRFVHKSGSQIENDIVRNYHRTYGMNTVIVMTTHLYGPGDSGIGFIPQLLESLFYRRPISVNQPQQGRGDWLEVTDFCWGIMQAFELGVPGGEYCFANDHSHDKAEIAWQVCALLDRITKEEPYRFASMDIGSFDRFLHFEDTPADEDLHILLNHKRALIEFGWYPEIPLDIGLEKMVRWYLDEKRALECAKMESGAWMNESLSSAVQA